MATVWEETSGLELVEWFMMAKIGYGHITSNIDDFIRFVGIELIRCVTDPVVMNECMRRWLDDQVVTGAATVMAMCKRLCQEVALHEMVYARFLYFMMKKDTELVDVGSKRMVSCAFTRFRDFEGSLEEDALQEWKRACEQEIVGLKDHVIETKR